MILKKLQIEGKSMYPTYSPGDLVLVSSLPYLFSNPREGDAIIIKYDGRLMIKRIRQIKRNSYFVIGDNESESTDSRKFGWLKRHQILGKVIYSNS